MIAIHGKENLDSSEVGRMAAIKIGSEPSAGQASPVVLDKSAELWRLPHVMFTSSPILVGNRVYQVTHTGELICVDAISGEELWEHKLENGQLHASPLYADGKLYVPMGNGNFYILKVKENGVDVLDKIELAGGCLMLQLFGMVRCTSTPWKNSTALAVKARHPWQRPLSKRMQPSAKALSPNCRSFLRTCSWLPEHVARWKLWDWTKT